MNGGKRYVMQKTSTSRHGSKTKDSASSSKHDQSFSDSEPLSATIPIIRQSENVKLLPRYSASMEDITSISSWLLVS